MQIAMSKWRPTVVTLLVIVSSGLVKAHVHFIRLALICIFGLMGMFLLHQLAQDWNKIRNGNKPANRPGGMGGGGMKPPKFISVLGTAGKLLRIVKRSAEPNIVTNVISFLCISVIV